jgi:hypothetical protein
LRIVERGFGAVTAIVGREFIFMVWIFFYDFRNSIPRIDTNTQETHTTRTQSTATRRLAPK